MTHVYDEYGAAYIEAPDGSWTRDYTADKSAKDRSELVEHIEWRARGKVLTEEQFLKMAAEHGNYSARALQVGWAMFSLGQLPASAIHR